MFGLAAPAHAWWDNDSNDWNNDWRNDWYN
jgi:hypothetical protein